MNEFLDNFINNALDIIGYTCIALLIGIAVLLFIYAWVGFFKTVLKTNREARIELKEEPGDPFDEFDNTKGGEE